MFMDFLDMFAKFLRQNTMYVAIALTTTAIAIYGVYIKKALKAATKKMNFFMRFVSYVFVYAFLLAFASTQTVKFLSRWLNGLDNGYLVLVVVLSFLVLGFLAKCEKQI